MSGEGVMRNVAGGLAPYARHLTSCRHWHDWRGGCDCGRDAALAGPAPEPAPRPLYAAAESVGAELHDRWTAICGGAPPFPREDPRWADMVQFALRRAAEHQADRENADGRG